MNLLKFDQKKEVSVKFSNCQMVNTKSTWTNKVIWIWEIFPYCNLFINFSDMHCSSGNINEKNK